MDSKRFELDKYYDFVRKCVICRKPYGTNSVIELSNVCPICQQRIIGKGTILDDTYHKAALRGGNVLAGKHTHTQKSAGGKVYE